LRAIASKVSELAADQHTCLELLLEDMKKEDIRLVGPDDLSSEDRRWLATMFRQNIFPILSPIAVDPAHPFPFIPNLGFGLVLELEGDERDENLVALVMVPVQLNRFIRLPGKGHPVHRTGKSDPDVPRSPVSFLYPAVQRDISGSSATVKWKLTRKPRTWCERLKAP
jgi:polyphosphate kinase